MHNWSKYIIVLEHTLKLYNRAKFLQLCMPWTGDEFC